MMDGQPDLLLNSGPCILNSSSCQNCGSQEKALLANASFEKKDTSAGRARAIREVRRGTSYFKYLTEHPYGFVFVTLTSLRATISARTLST